MARPDLIRVGPVRAAVLSVPPITTDTDWQKQRGGRIDSIISPESPMDGDDRIDEAIAESFPASDPPSWNSGLDDDVQL